MSEEEAQNRITFLSAGLAMTAEQIAERWPEWHAEEAKIEKKHGRDSPKHLGWKCRLARPAFVALGFIAD